MFTKEDYQEYFDLIMKKEEEMVAHLKGLISQVSDEQLLAVLKSLQGDEERHANIARRLFTYLT